MSYNTGSREAGLDWKFHALPALDLKAATEKIEKGEASYNFATGELGIVSRCDTIQVASNAIIKDYMVSSSMDVGKDQKWHGRAVCDGHGGRHTAEVLSHALIPYVERSLKAHFKSTSDGDPIDSAITSAFTALADEISSDGLATLGDARTHAEAQARLAPSYAGSCALLAIYDPAGSMVHVANVGDARVVLGRHSAETENGGNAQSWTAIPLSNDHNTSNPSEAERVKALHPGESDLITKRDGDTERYVQIAVTRAFGDARWNWPKDVWEIAQKQYSGGQPLSSVLNSPYLVATPEIKSIEIQKGDFLIIASDGLWDHLTSEDAVHAVGLRIEAMKAGEVGHPKYVKEAAVGGGPALVDKAEGISFLEAWEAKREYFIVENDNAATHLVKNAFGGSQRQLFTAVLTVDSPTSRMMRDDLTVQVIFFGDI